MKYGTILIDPPWRYRQVAGKGKKAGDSTRGGLDYPTMSMEELMGLDIMQYADKDCILWLWTTNSHIPCAFPLMEKWGFKYKTMVTWAKNQIGLGFWLRGQTEHLLLGIRGNPREGMIGPHGATGKSWSTLITSKRGEHSVKPEVFIDMIEDISPEPRLEIFARRHRFGWDVIGNQGGDIL